MQRFKAFWEADKSITEDIHFKASKSHTDIFMFDDVSLIGPGCEGIVLNGDFNCRTGSMTVNFVMQGVGSVRRFCLGGAEHGDAGRNHEHVMREDADASPGSNLPHAIPRADLEKLSPDVVWREICREAKIGHTGRFRDPLEWCP